MLAREWQKKIRWVWPDLCLAPGRVKSPARKHARRHSYTVVNTRAQAVPLPHSSLWHTDWLIVWWARFWHTDCATLSPERDRLSLRPPSSIPLSGRPPLVSMQFLGEREAPCLPPPSSSSGGWQQGWGARREAGQAEWDDLHLQFLSFFCCCFALLFYHFSFFPIVIFISPTTLAVFSSCFSPTLMPPRAAFNPSKKNVFSSLSIPSIQTQRVLD